MAFLRSLEISGSALTAQRLRMDIIAENLANAGTTRTENGGPYVRKTVVLEARTNKDEFGRILAQKSAGMGVRVREIVEDTQEAFKLEYDPSHPDAGEDGYVRYPNVDTTQEMIDMMAASRSYNANVTVINAIKLMASKALEIGK